MTRSRPSNHTCPSCRAAMEVHVLPGVNGVHGGVVELDLCFACQGLWFDPQENLKLSPAAVAELFKLLHDHRDTHRQPLAAPLGLLFARPQGRRKGPAGLCQSRLYQDGHQHGNHDQQGE